MFRRYHGLLTSGKMVEQDEEALLLFPTRFKKQRGKTYAACKLCGRQEDEDRMEAGICPSCLHEGETYHCATCGAEMHYTNYQKYVKQSKRHTSCKSCYDRKNMVAERRVCTTCGASFGITCGQRDYFNGRGLALPKRCEKCRGGGQQVRQQTHTRTPTNGSSTGGTSFLENVLRSLFS